MIDTIAWIDPRGGSIRFASGKCARLTGCNLENLIGVFGSRKAALGKAVQYGIELDGSLGWFEPLAREVE